MKSLNPKTSLLLFVLLSTGIFTAFGQQVTKTFTGIKKINLSTSSGSCQLVKSSSNEVQVKVTHTFSSDEYKTLMEQEGSTLILKEDFSKRGSYSGKSSWVLTIPENLDIKFSTGSGDLEINDLTVNINSNSGSGDYDLNNVKGESKVNTGSGDITIAGYKGDLNLNAGSGDIQIKQGEGDFKANTGSGSIKFYAIQGAMSLNVGSGNISANEIVLKGKSMFNTGSGDASVVLASSPEYNISVNSGSGDATLDFNKNKMDGTLIMTANKKNGKITAPLSFDKTEELDDDNNQVRIRKTAKLGEKDIQIKVSTGSGTAEVKK
jgi:hypothetical protein